MIKSLETSSNFFSDLGTMVLSRHKKTGYGFRNPEIRRSAREAVTFIKPEQSVKEVGKGKVKVSFLKDADKDDKTDDTIFLYINGLKVIFLQFA